MIIELEDKFNASIHMQSLQEKVNNVRQSDFQRKLFLTICILSQLKLLGFGHIIHIFDSCMVMFVYDDPIILLIYFACYSTGQLCALQRYIFRFQYHCSILQIIILGVIFMSKQPGMLVIIGFIIKSLLNGYMNQVLQMLRFQLVKISINVGYLITIVFSIMAMICNRFGYSNLRCVCVIEFIVLVIFIKQSARLPPLIESCLENEVDVYIKYIEKCVQDSSILNYEEFKNADEQISIIQTFQVRVHKPTLRKLLTKLSKFHEQIYKYFVCQTLQGFLFYSNLTFLKYCNSDSSNHFVDIMLLSIFGASSKPFHQFLVGLYSQRQVYWVSQSICIFSQVLKLLNVYLGRDAILLVASLLQGVFHYNVTTEIHSDYRTLILGVSQICRHLGGMFLAYSVYDYLHEQLYEFLFIQLIVAQLTLCYFGFQTSIQF